MLKGDPWLACVPVVEVTTAEVRNNSLMSYSCRTLYGPRNQRLTVAKFIISHAGQTSDPCLTPTVIRAARA